MLEGQVVLQRAGTTTDGRPAVTKLNECIAWSRADDDSPHQLQQPDVQRSSSNGVIQLLLPGSRDITMHHGTRER